MTDLLSLLQLGSLVALLGLAVLTDLRERRIPNKLTVAGIGVGLVLAAFLENGVPLMALAGVVVGLAAALPIYALGAFGAGDAKLLAAVGCFVGPGGVLSVVFYGILAGGGLALASVIRRGALAEFGRRFGQLVLYCVTLGRRGQRGTLASPGSHTVPYAVAIAAGAVLAWSFPISLLN